MSSAIDVTKPEQGKPTTAAQRANWATAKAEIEDVQSKSVAALLVGSGAPAGVANATFIGQEYLDTGTKQFHRATATGTGGWVKINTGAGLHISAFGIYPGSTVDNTAAFNNQLIPYLTDTSPLFREQILTGPGDFYFDEVRWPGQNETKGAFAGYYGGCDIRGAGEGFAGIAGSTRFIPNITSKPVFMSNDRGLIMGLKIKGISIWGRGSSNPGQCGWYIDGQAKTIDDNVGGVRKTHISDIFIGNFSGRPLVIKGGLTDALCPNDFWQVEGVYVDRPTGVHLPGITIIGQFGQAILIGCRSGASTPTNNLAPCWYVGQHPAYNAPVPTAVNANVLTSGTTPHRFYLGQPVRVFPVAGAVPTGLAAGTTYYAVPKNLGTTSCDFGLASSLSNAVTETLVPISDIGTGCRFLRLWASSLASNEYTCADLDLHLLSSGDMVRFIGSSLPLVNGVQVNSGDRFWAVWTGFKTFKVATSLANAKTRTTAAVSGGTIGNYGWMVTDGTFAAQYSAFRPKFLQCTAEGGQLGMFLAGVQQASVQPYFENLAIGFMVCGPNDFTSMPNLSIADGGFALVTNCLYASDTQTLVKIDLDSLSVLSSGGFYPTNGAQLLITNNKQQTLATSTGAVTAVNWIVGANVTVPIGAGNITSLDWNANSIKAGAKGVILFIQDGGGGRTVALGSNWKGPSIGSGTAGQKCMVPYYNDGTHSLYTTSGWS